MTWPVPDTPALPDIPDEEVPQVDWETFNDYHFDWKQDEHVGLVGPTGSGKSTLMFNLLPRRKYVAFFAMKPRDATLTDYAKKNKFKIYSEWPDSHRSRNPFKKVDNPQDTPRRIIWPDATNLYSQGTQRQVFQKAIQDIYASGGWCVCWDEFWGMTNLMDLEKESRILLQQARSNNISFVMGAQRPSRIPLEMFDQSSHLFFFRDNDERNLKNISGIGWLSRYMIIDKVANLPPHDFLYINTRTGSMCQSICPNEV